MWSVISDTQPPVSPTETKIDGKCGEDGTRGAKMVGQRATMLPPYTVFISHHQKEAGNEGNPDRVPRNVHIAGSRPDSSIPYLMSYVV